MLFNDFKLTRLPDPKSLIAGLGLLMLSACSLTLDSKPVSQTPEVLLLGEVHDNPEGHALRLEALKSRSATWGEGVAVVFEQFDRSQQQALDKAVKECSSANCVIKMAGVDPWDWPLYHPVIDYALSRNWSIVAGNLSMKDVRESVQSGVESVLSPDIIQRFSAFRPWPADWQSAQTESIELGHCGMLPREVATQMVNAQLARDLWMAHSIASQIEQGNKVVLIAGNGHIDRITGVPFWLERWITQEEHSRLRATRVTSIGFIESQAQQDKALETANPQFDVIKLIAPAQRPDPCEQFKKHMQNISK